MTKIIVTTIWAYPPDRPVSHSPLAQSCERLGVPLTVFQRGEPFVNMRQNKLTMFLAEVADLDFDAILYIDGDDAILTRGDAERTVGDVLQHYGADFVVGAEVICWPWAILKSKLPASPARCNYPNAGVWCATHAGFLREFTAMQAIVDDDTEHYSERGQSLDNQDQAAFQVRIASGASGMAIDSGEKLVLNLNFLDYSHDHLLADLQGRRLPLVVHGSGPSKTRLRELWKDWQEASR